MIPPSYICDEKLEASLCCPRQTAGMIAAKSAINVVFNIQRYWYLLIDFILAESTLPLAASPHFQSLYRTEDMRVPRGTPLANFATSSASELGWMRSYYTS
jgi:hypothetical protein